MSTAPSAAESTDHMMREKVGGSGARTTASGNDGTGTVLCGRFVPLLKTAGGTASITELCATAGGSDHGALGVGFRW